MQTASNRDAENFPVIVWNAGANPDRLAPSYLVFLRLLFILMSNGTSCGRRAAPSPSSVRLATLGVGEAPDMPER